MREQDREIALRLKREIAKIAEIVDFRVYGSRARGDAEEDSDMDVFVEVEFKDRALEDSIQYASWEVGFEYLMHISTLVFSRDEFENSPMRISPIVLNILEEGVPV